jgi:hypothetical protein
MYRPCIPRFSEADAREITSNLSTSFMTMDSAGILRPKIVEGSTAPIAAYLINNQPTPNDLMAPVHWVALESLGIIGDKLKPMKHKSQRHGSGSRRRSSQSPDRSPR